MALDSNLKQTVSDQDWNKGKRVRENISLTAKGLVQPEITVETLNTDKIISVKSPNDVGDIDEQTTAEFLWSRLDAHTEQAHKRGLKMVWEA